MTQEEMLNSQWSDTSAFGGFTQSDWFTDLKEVTNLWGYVQNGGKAQTVGTDQSGLMYAIEQPSQPDAMYENPRNQSGTTNQPGGINPVYVIGGLGLAALLFIAVK